MYEDFRSFYIDALEYLRSISDGTDNEIENDILNCEWMLMCLDPNEEWEGENAEGVSEIEIEDEYTAAENVVLDYVIDSDYVVAGTTIRNVINYGEVVAYSLDSVEKIENNVFFTEVTVILGYKNQITGCHDAGHIFFRVRENTAEPYLVIRGQDWYREDIDYTIAKMVKECAPALYAGW